MSSIIEADAYAQNFHSSDVTVTNSSMRFQALIALLVVMVVAAFAGIIFTAPFVTITAGLITAASVVYVSLSHNS